jgi:hypothetical protein
MNNSSNRVPALQAGSPEFKLQSHPPTPKKEKKRKEKNTWKAHHYFFYTTRKRIRKLKDMSQEKCPNWRRGDKGE